MDTSNHAYTLVVLRVWCVCVTQRTLVSILAKPSSIQNRVNRRLTTESSFYHNIHKAEFYVASRHYFRHPTQHGKKLLVWKIPSSLYREAINLPYH